MRSGTETVPENFLPTVSVKRKLRFQHQIESNFRNGHIIGTNEVMMTPKQRFKC